MVVLPDACMEDHATLDEMSLVSATHPELVVTGVKVCVGVAGV
jgi:hypothetical protein